MQSEYIFLKDFGSRVKFTEIVNRYSVDINVESSIYKLDAKSILGLFGLNLSKPLRIVTQQEFPESLIRELDCFIVKNRCFS